MFNPTFSLKISEPNDRTYGQGPGLNPPSRKPTTVPFVSLQKPVYPSKVEQIQSELKECAIPETIKNQSQSKEEIQQCLALLNEVTSENPCRGETIHNLMNSSKSLYDNRLQTLNTLKLEESSIQKWLEGFGIMEEISNEWEREIEKEQEKDKEQFNKKKETQDEKESLLKQLKERIKSLDELISTVSEELRFYKTIYETTERSPE